MSSDPFPIFGAPQSCKVAAGSLLAHTVIPSKRYISSREFNWKSLLVDVHSGVSSYEEYESVPTPDVRIGVSLSGSFRCDVYERKQWRDDTFTPGAMMLHYTSDPTSYRFPKPKDDDYKLALIYVPQDLVEAANEDLRRVGSPSRIPEFNSALGRDRTVYEIAHALVDAMGKGGDDLYADVTASWLAVHVLRRYGAMATGDEDRSAGEISHTRLARVLEFMSANYGEALTLESLSSEACISKFHFVRLFKAKTGQSPMKHLTDIRLKAAKRLLLSSDLSVADIACSCGFASSSHLAKQFASRFGLSPSRYRVLSETTGKAF
jgi:AraC family transcriptional regulator